MERSGSSLASFRLQTWDFNRSLETLRNGKHRDRDDEVFKEATQRQVEVCSF